MPFPERRPILRLYLQYPTINSPLAQALDAHAYHTSLLLQVSTVLKFVRVPPTEKRVTQRNLLNPPHVRIIHKIRINIKENRHIHRLPSIQPLLLETKTLNLAEVRCNLARRHTIRRHPNYILIRHIRRCVEC